MKRFLLKFLRSEDGPTSVEYAVMLAMLLGVFIGSIGLIGQETEESMENSSDRIETAFEESGVKSGKELEDAGEVTVMPRLFEGAPEV